MEEVRKVLLEKISLKTDINKYHMFFKPGLTIIQRKSQRISRKMLMKSFLGV